MIKTPLNTVKMLILLYIVLFFVHGDAYIYADSKGNDVNSITNGKITNDVNANNQIETTTIAGVNSEYLSVKCVIWENIIVKNKPFHITILIRNMGRHAFDIPDYIKDYVFSWTKRGTGKVDLSMGNAGGPRERLRLSPGQFITYSLEHTINDSGEGDFSILFNNTVQEVRLIYGLLKVEDEMRVVPSNPKK